jgi:hypothetical protein
MADYSQLMDLEKKTKEKSPPASQPESKTELKSVPERPNGRKNDNSPTPKSAFPQTRESSVPERANARTTQRPNVRRIITRNSFEIYEDQMDSLRQLAYTEKMQGKIGSMSAMVRDAIDTYILNKSAEK